MDDEVRARCMKVEDYLNEGLWEESFIPEMQLEKMRKRV